MSFESFVALRYLKSKRKEVFISIITIISILGVAVSVMVLDIVLAVMTGFEKELQAKLIDTSAHVVIRRYGGEIDHWEEVREKVKEVPGVVSVTPYTYNQAMLAHQGSAHGLLVRGVADTPAERAKLGKMLAPDERIDALFQPALITLERPDGIVDTIELPPLIVGRSLRNRYSLVRGGPVTLLSPQFSASPQGLIPKLRRFVVVGTYSSGLVEYESGLAYTSLAAAQSFFGLGSAVSGLEVSVTALDEAPRIAGLIREKLLDQPFEVADWTVPNKPLWDALRLEKRVYFIVLLLLILIASFSIVSTLVMIVMEKSRDIAILKTMGAEDRSILKIFLLDGIIIGSTGTVLGTVLGLLGALALREYGFRLDETVFSLSQVPVRIVPLNFLLVAVSGFIITALAGIYPARRAAKLRPADALRFE